MAAPPTHAATGTPERLLFQQSHRLPRWILVLLAFSAVMPCAIIGAMALTGRMPMLAAALVLALVLAVDSAVAWLVWSLRLNVAVTDRALYIAARPFLNVRLTPGDIAEARLAGAPAGAGANWAPVRGWSINHGASVALSVKTRAGRRYTAGTDQPDELGAALRELGVAVHAAR